MIILVMRIFFMQLQDLVSFCFRFAMNHMTDVVQTESFVNLGESTVKEFIKKAAEKGAFKT